MYSNILIRRLCILSWVLLTTFPLGANSMQHLQGLGKVDYFECHSQLLDQTYHLYVSVPTNTQKGLTYPIVYLLDGGLTFPILAGYRTYLEMQEEIPTHIVVGISYGTNDWEQGNHRSRDFTAPAKERDYWGGAEAFQKMLSTEIIPLIEPQYPVDSSRRVLFGQVSWGSIRSVFCLHGS